MVRITEDLIRKRAEHNEKMISTLEEVSLHQENIDKIENIQNWCKNLEILLLQGNIISKIENLQKLKKLRYLNLALNNIERIENLEGLESLEKLDLTLNFIGEITSVVNLKGNINLRQLILTGNPCCDYKYYRDYIIETLPQLNDLDCMEIKRNERILAKQNIDSKIKEVISSECEHKIKRIEQLQSYGDHKQQLNVEDMEKFWKEPSQNTPEERIKMARCVEQSRNLSKQDENSEKNKPLVRRFTPEGRPLNINKPKIPYQFSDNGKDIVLDVAVYKYLDTAYIEVDVQTNFVAIYIKNQLLQLCLDCEVHPAAASCQRSMTTGHLVVTMPKANPSGHIYVLNKPKKDDQNKAATPDSSFSHEMVKRREYLEIGRSEPSIRSLLHSLDTSDVPDLK